MAKKYKIKITKAYYIAIEDKDGYEVASDWSFFDYKETKKQAEKMLAEVERIEKETETDNHPAVKAIHEATEEMIMFRQLLDKHGIKYVDESEPESYIPIYRTHFNYRGYDWSVIHGYGTYGGFSRFESDKGLLEVMSGAINDGNPIGYLTAQEVMGYVLGEMRN